MIATTAAAVVALSGCATIVSDSKYPTTFNSSPSGAEVTIKNQDGLSVARETTPFTTTLQASDGYFKKMRYTATFHKRCYQDQTVPLKTSVDGWYWANLAFGGVIGFLIVDPATGSMYKIDPNYSVAMAPASDTAGCNSDNGAQAAIDAPRPPLRRMDSI